MNEVLAGRPTDIRVRGARFAVRTYGEPGGTPVLFLHGFPQHSGAWALVAAELAGDPVRLVCPDLRGFGASEGTRRGYAMDDLAADMLALLDALGLERVGLVGHDWGAYAGFRMCLRAPERFSGYVALNMPHPWPRQRAVLPNVWRLWYTAPVEYPVVGRAVLRHWPAYTRHLLRRQAGDPAVWSDAELADYAAATGRAAHAAQSMFFSYVVHEIPALVRGTARAHRLTVPTVLLGGAQDPVFPPSLLAGGEPYADDLTVRIVPGAGHFLPQERPDEVASAIRAGLPGAGRQH